MSIRYVTIGIYYNSQELPDFRILTVDAEDEQAAIDTVEDAAVGNVPKTTLAWTDESFLGLANDCSGGNADYVSTPTNDEAITL